MEKNKRKAAPGVRDRKRHEGIRINENTTSTRKNFITEEAKIQGISSFLPNGKQNAISSTDLMEVLSISSVRELRHIIANARESGEIILSNSNGYFLPSQGEEGLKEIVDCVKVLRSKGVSTLKAAAAIKKPLKNIYGQQIIDEIERIGHSDDWVLSLFSIERKEDSEHG